MSDLEYIEFLDWLRRRDRVVLRLEDGTTLAEGHRPLDAFERWEREIQMARSIRRMGWRSSGLVERMHGKANVVAFFAQRREAA